MAYVRKLVRDEGGKQCTKCRVYKAWSEFSKDRSTKDGHTSRCLECRNVNNAKWRGENLEHARAASRAWVAVNKDYVRETARGYAQTRRAELGKEGWRKAVKEWNEANPEKLRAQRKNHYAANRLRLRDKQKRDREARPDAYRTYDANKRAKRKGRYVQWACKSEIQAAYDLAAHLTETSGILHHVDHVLPLVGRKVSGLHVGSNLRVVTAQENLEKGNKHEP